MTSDRMVRPTDGTRRGRLQPRSGRCRAGVRQGRVVHGYDTLFVEIDEQLGVRGMRRRFVEAMSHRPTGRRRMREVSV